MVNKIILAGNVGADPETSQTQSGMQMSKFRIATNFKQKGDTKTTWHNIVTFGKTAEIVANYVRKGRLVYVEGRLDISEYMKQDNTKGLNVSVIANDVKLMDKQPTDARQQPQQPMQQQPQQPMQQQPQQPMQQQPQQPMQQQPQQFNGSPDGGVPDFNNNFDF